MINKTKHMSQDLSYLHDWVFHFNTYEEEWAAIQRESYNEYWSDRNAPGIIRSNALDTLIEMLHKTKGDISKIDDHFNIEYE